MNAISSAESGDSEGGPMWGRFFDSIGGGDDNESVVSGSHAHEPNTPSRFAPNSLLEFQDSPHSEVHPNDSASVVDEVDDGAHNAGPGASSVGGTNSQAPVVPVDDGTYVFKFRTPSGRTHRFQARHDNIETLVEIVTGKLSSDPFFIEWDSSSTAPKPDPTDFQLQYTDADGDVVIMSSDTDVEDAVKNARITRTDRVVLIIQGGKGWNEAGAAQSEAKAKEVTEAAIKETKEVDKAESTPSITVSPSEAPTMAPPAKVHVSPPDDIMGIPRDMILPASIGALAVVIVGIFTISRLTRDSY